jgi:hypothetical protein
VGRKSVNATQRERERDYIPEKGMNENGERKERA